MAAPSSPPPPARPKFFKLPGRLPLLRFRMGSSANATLWLGEEFALEVEQVFCRQLYRRFFYGDIQAMLVRATSRGFVYTVILAAVAALFGLLAFSADLSQVRVIWEGFCGFFIIMLLINVARGPTCVCYMQTALGLRRMPTLSRSRPTRKAIRLIRERIDAVQGPLAADDAAQRLEQFLEQQAIVRQPSPRP